MLYSWKLLSGIFIIIGLFVEGFCMEYQWISLNGYWDLQPGKDLPDRFHHSVAVPGLVDVADPKIDWQNHEYFWYRKSFSLSERSEYINLFLQLTQVKYGTEIWLNGQKVGGDIPCYTSQEFDLTPYLNPGQINQLLVRVGQKNTLPENSPVGNDFEKVSWIPGIWGDVHLHFYGSARIKWTRILPDIYKNKVKLHYEIQPLGSDKKELSIRYRIKDKKSGREVFPAREEQLGQIEEKIKTVDLEIHFENFNLWSPENPYLYILETELLSENQIIHRQSINFGMREFSIRNGGFYLNGKRRVLFGSNIPFHRMLSDPTRGTLPWRTSWIRKVLIDIPKRYNMFFFRFHLGHAYNRWYDLADEYGIMLQDEWLFWTSSGSQEQISEEFTAWIRENINHPSIVIWDALNESENEWITSTLIPELKKIDPSRPWEMVDFGEDHPYIYSLGSVLNNSKFGFARSINDLEKSPEPVMVNEYLWWWLDRDDNPTHLTDIVIERWLGRKYTKDQLWKHQAFLARELTELWRRLDLDGILPFVYLSIGEGATANWFSGPLKELQPKPVLEALKNAFAPVGLSIELWDRHFMISQIRRVPVYLFNDSQEDETINLILSLEGNNQHTQLIDQTHNLAAGMHMEIEVPLRFEENTGSYELVGTIYNSENIKLADSRKPLFIFNPQYVSFPEKLPRLAVHDPSGELTDYLTDRKIIYHEFSRGFQDAQVIIINHGGLDDIFTRFTGELTQFVDRGGILIIQEPAYGVINETEILLLYDLSIFVNYRPDPDRGGYDSYIFPEDGKHFLWEDIDSEYLKMFNGGFGGEIVSQYNVKPTVPYSTVASCNLSLKVPAVLEIPYGSGWIIISRVQIRGRLSKNGQNDDLYKRRYDPIAEKYFLNLLTGYVNATGYQRKIKTKLKKQQIYIARAKASSGQIYDALDNKMETRWSSDATDPQWAWLDLGKLTNLNKITMHWEVAYGKEYKILMSTDNTTWIENVHIKSSDGAVDEINVGGVATRYIKIEFIQRGTQWGYSIWELQLE
jgi:hypothetical protein